MNHRGEQKYYTLEAITLSRSLRIASILFLAIAFCLQKEVMAETKSDISPLSFKNKLSNEWENAVVTHTLDVSTAINILKFSPDGEMLAGVGASQIMLWQVDNGQIQRILPGHQATELKMKIAPTAIAFSPDSQFLATATWSQGLLNPDHSLLVRDIATGEEVLNIAEPDGCRQVSFDPEGKILYAACGFGVTAWSFPEGKELFSFDTKHGVEAIALSPDGQVMATVDANVSAGQQGEESNRIQIWQLEREQPSLIATLDGHDNDIAQLEFTADGRKLVSSSYDGKINVWHWQTGEIARKTNNLYSNSGLFSLNHDNKLIAGNFHSSSMTSLITGLPLRKTMMIPRRGQTSAIAFDPQGKVFAWAGKSAKSRIPVINLWQINPSASEISSTVEDDYLSLPISQYWGNQEKAAGEATVKLNTANPSPVGSDPQEIAIAALGLREIVESEQEEVELDYPQENLATVTITQTNLADDSTAGMRYMVKFAPYGDLSDEQWRVVWAGKQFKCQANRGHQDWSTDLCN